MALPCPKTTHNHNFEIGEIEGWGGWVGGVKKEEKFVPI